MSVLLRLCLVSLLTIKVQRSRSILVDLFDDSEDVVFGQLVVKLTQDLFQRVRGNVAVACSRIDGRSSRVGCKSILEGYVASV